MAPFIRTLIVSLFLAGLVLLGYWRITSDEQAKAIRELQAMQAEMERTLAARQAMIERLSRSHRIAHVQVLAQTAGEQAEERLEAADVAEHSAPSTPHSRHAEPRDTTVRFIELDDEGGELASQVFTIPGNMLFIDAWSVKFEAERIAQGDPLRGRTLILLRRIYSDRLAPRDGFPIDTPGAVPPGYAASDMSRFEKRVWENFWELAADPVKARELGVRVAQGEAVYKPVRAGQSYELIVDAAGGMSLTPLALEALAPAGASATPAPALSRAESADR